MELLVNPALLARPDLELAQLTVSGLALGALAARVPRHEIVEAQRARSVMRIHTSDVLATGPGRHLDYLDGRGTTLTLDRVIDDVVRAGGTLHLAADVGLRVWGGRVTRFSLYGDALREFAELKSEEEMLTRFGAPDRLLVLEADGDLMAHDAYYARSRKWIRWDHRSRRLAVVALGGNASDLRAGQYGGIVRHECALQGRSGAVQERSPSIIFRDRAGRALSEADLQGSQTVHWELVGAGDVSPQARLLHQQGRTVGSKGDAAQALRLFEAAHALSPQWPAPIYDAAFTHLLADAHERALGLYTQVDLLAPRGFFAAKTTLHLLRRELAREVPLGTTRLLLLLEWQPDSERDALLSQLLTRHSDLGPAWLACATGARTPEARAYAVECGLQARCDAETLGRLWISKSVDLHRRGEREAGIAQLVGVALDPDTTLANEALAKAALRGLLGKEALN